MKKIILELVLPVALVLLATVLIRLIDADLKAASSIYETYQGWSGDRFPWNVLYTYAPLPGLVLAVGALLIFIVGFFKQTLRSYRKQTAFLVLMIALGPGLIINAILKDNMGRARPADIIEFAGTHQYSEAWQYGVSPGQKSFPSGHASIAFYMMAPWFILRRKYKKTALIFLGSGLFYGGLVGFSRMAQGGHYLSDVLWAGCLVYLCGVVLSWIMNPALRSVAQDLVPDRDSV